MQRKSPYNGLADNELLVLFHNVKTEKYKSYLCCFSSNIFRKMTISEAKELMKWNLKEKELKISLKKRNILKLSKGRYEGSY
jgi:hypothetical protein